MNWFRRRGPDPPTPDPATAPDAGTSPPGVETPSLEGAAPGLAALLEGLDREGDHAVLDLGRAVGAKLDLYGSVARRMRFVDLLETGAAPGSGAGPASGPKSWAGAVASIPGEADPRYDLVLAWDILDRMPPDQHPALVERLARLVPPKGRLHLMVAASEAALPELFRFTPAGPGRLRYEATGIPRPLHPRLHPAEVERVLAPFRVNRAFTLKVGFREFVAIR